AALLEEFELAVHFLENFFLQLRLVLEAADPVEKLAGQLRQLSPLDIDNFERQINLLPPQGFIVRFGRNGDLRRGGFLGVWAGLVADQKLVKTFELGIGQAERRLDLNRLLGELRELLPVVSGPQRDGDKLPGLDRSLVSLQLAIFRQQRGESFVNFFWRKLMH